MRLCEPLGWAGEKMNNESLAEKIATELLKRDGVAVIWQAHLTAARAKRDGYPKAAEILLKIADAAEDAARRNGAPPQSPSDAPLFQLVGSEMDSGCAWQQHRRVHGRFGTTAKKDGI